MSYLKFERIGHVQLHSATGILVGIWPAHNDTASRSNGRWPSGRYAWSHYNPHAEIASSPNCIASSYGCEGIHVFDVSEHGRTGMGIHAGRVQVRDIFSSNLGGRTLGCVRTTENAMRTINSTHSVDALTHIVISEGWFANDRLPVA